MEKEYTQEQAQQMLHSEQMRHTTEHIADYGDNYSESKLWSKLRSVACKAGKPVISVVLSLFYILASGNVSVKYKTMIIGALGYFILPIDLLPDMIVGLGYADDLTALLTVYNVVKKHLTPDIQAQVDAKLREWKII